MISAFRVLALADDLTGALEVGAKFAAHGMPSRIVSNFATASTQHDPVLVIDTETRHLPETDAAECVRSAATWARTGGADLVYKKTDSTLRGNIAAELRGMQAVFPETRILYAPAYPELGRTVRNGELLVEGVPVHQTEFALDAWSPVRDCRVRDVIRGVDAVVIDGECTRDIDDAAQKVLADPAPRICAGPAALAEALARRIGLVDRQPLKVGPIHRCLIVNGSMHPASRRQIETAAMAGLFDHDWVLLDPELKGAGRGRAAEVGHAVQAKLGAGRFDAIVVFGGDTAFGIHEALGSVPFEALGEVVSGVAVSRSSGLLWMTKAGGFGVPDVLIQIRERLT